MNMIRSAITIIAIIAIAVPVFYAQADEVPTGASRRITERNARLSKVTTHKGSLFGSHSYFIGVIPDDIDQLDDVGVVCDESGAPVERSPARCRRFKSDSANTTFVVRLNTRAEHLTFYYENKGGKQILVPYTRYNNGTYKMSFMSDKAEQFATAHGLGIKDTTASTSQTEVVATATKCDNLFEPLKRACLSTLSADKKPVNIVPVLGGIVDNAKK